MKTPITNYPTVVGNRRMSVVLHSGPNPYVPYDEGTGLGGDVLTARECGLKYIDAVCLSGGASDARFVRPLMQNIQRPPGFGGMQEVTLIWYEPTSVELAGIDISDLTVRLLVFGE